MIVEDVHLTYHHVTEINEKVSYSTILLKFGLMNIWIIIVVSSGIYVAIGT